MTNPFSPLKEKIFLKLYFSQTISLLGDAFTWAGIGLLAFQSVEKIVFIPLLILWLIAGFGQTLAEMPSQILIAENIPKEEHGKVYRAHFAWSHFMVGICLSHCRLYRNTFQKQGVFNWSRFIIGFTYFDYIIILSKKR